MNPRPRQKNIRTVPEIWERVDVDRRRYDPPLTIRYVVERAVRSTTGLPPWLWEAIELEAEQTGRELGEIFARALEAYLQAPEHEAGPGGLDVD